MDLEKPERRYATDDSGLHDPDDIDETYASKDDLNNMTADEKAEKLSWMAFGALLSKIDLIHPGRMFKNLGAAILKLGHDLLNAVIWIFVALFDSINWLISTTMGAGDNTVTNDIFFGFSESETAFEFSDDSKADTYLDYYGNVTSASTTVYAIDMDKALIYPEDETKESDEMANFKWKPENANFSLPNIRVTPMTIFSNKVDLLNANYFDTDRVNHMSDETKSLRNTIIKWYKLFRIIAVTALLSVLVYIGIRIVLTSIASDKAKYKTMFVDWLIAICLVFSLHYIMAFTMILVDEITSAVAGDEAERIPVQVLKSRTGANSNKILQTGSGKEVKFITNLTGLMRLKCTYKDTRSRLSWSIIYIALTIYTIIFLWVYLKRLLTLSFLTLIAPLVAITYPIDKIRDGKAQAFTYWLREYIINAILPIVHSVLYMIFVNTAVDMAIKYPIYAIAALAFIIPGEKIIREMFGISSQNAPPPGGGFAAGAAVSALMNKGKGLLSAGGRGGGGGSGKDDDDGDDDNGNVRETNTGGGDDDDDTYNEGMSQEELAGEYDSLPPPPEPDSPEETEGGDDNSLPPAPDAEPDSPEETEGGDDDSLPLAPDAEPDSSEETEGGDDDALPPPPDTGNDGPEGPEGTEEADDEPLPPAPQPDTDSPENTEKPAREYDASGYDQDGFDKQGFDRQGYNADGYDRNGFDRNGLDSDGYNRRGFDTDGYDRNGFDKNGFDKNGFDADGLDKDGYDRDGFKDGYNRNGYDRDGFNRDGVNRFGFDRETLKTPATSTGFVGRNGYLKSNVNDSIRDARDQIQRGPLKGARKKVIGGAKGRYRGFKKSLNQLGETDKQSLRASNGTKGVKAKIGAFAHNRGRGLVRIGKATSRYIRKKYGLPKGAKGVAYALGRMARTGLRTAGKVATVTAKVGLGVAGVVGGATVGLAAGITSGNLEDIGKGIATGAAGGLGLGVAGGKFAGRGIKKATGTIDRAGKKLEKKIDSGGFFAKDKEAIRVAKYGEKEAGKMKADDEFVRDQGNRRFLEEKGLSEREITERLKVYNKYRRLGVSDIKEMDRQYNKLKDEGKTDKEITERVSSYKDFKDHGLRRIDEMEAAKKLEEDYQRQYSASGSSDAEAKEKAHKRALGTARSASRHSRSEYEDSEKRERMRQGKEDALKVTHGDRARAISEQLIADEEKIKRANI